MEFGQDIPPSLKRLLDTKEPEECPLSVSSVGSRRSSLISPASAKLPSLSSLFSEPDSSLMSSTMFAYVFILAIYLYGDVFEYLPVSMEMCLCMYLHGDVLVYVSISYTYSYSNTC